MFGTMFTDDERCAQNVWIHQHANRRQRGGELTKRQTVPRWYC